MVIARAAVYAVGHIPAAPGETVIIDSHTAEVTGRAVTQIRLRRPKAAPRQEMVSGA